MGKFDGKVFLELGTSIASVDMVKYAKSEGAYVIVTDYLPAEKSEAKQYADETAMISTQDVDELTEFAREKKVDGVFCGVSEPNLLSVRKIAERLGLPCYFTEEQWNLCQNKDEFKKLCEKHGVPVPKSYILSDQPTPEELSAIKYPVIVKPVDRRAGIGIHICKDEWELLAGYKDAYEKSLSHRVTVEQYLEGEEIYAYYIVSNGEYVLVAINQVYLNRSRELPLPIPDELVTHVSRDQLVEQYLREINDNLIAMMKSIGFQNGTFFVQGIKQKDGRIHLFESGLRLPGGKSHNIVAYVSGANTIHAMTNYALTGQMGIDISRMDVVRDNAPGRDKIFCTFCILCRAGTIGKIEGIEAITDMCPDIEPLIFYHAGETVPTNIPLRRRFIYACVVGNSVEDTAKKIQAVRAAVKIWDENGVDMIIPPMKVAT